MDQLIGTNHANATMAMLNTIRKSCIFMSRPDDLYSQVILSYVPIGYLTSATKNTKVPSRLRVTLLNKIISIILITSTMMREASLIFNYIGLVNFQNKLSLYGAAQ